MDRDLRMSHQSFISTISTFEVSANFGGGEEAQIHIHRSFHIHQIHHIHHIHLISTISTVVHIHRVNERSERHRVSNRAKRLFSQPGILLRLLGNVLYSKISTGKRVISRFPPYPPYPPYPPLLNFGHIHRTLLFISTGSFSHIHQVTVFHIHPELLLISTISTFHIHRELWGGYAWF